MGTRADFYVGHGEKMEWLGSIAWDGYPRGVAAKGDVCAKPEELGGHPVFAAKIEKEYREAVEKLLASRDDAILPKDGWPWPWKDSCLTDYSYSFFHGKTWASIFGRRWYDPVNDGVDERSEEEQEIYHNGQKIEFPDMSDVQNVALGKRSGVIVVKVPEIEN